MFSLVIFAVRFFRRGPSLQNMGEMIRVLNLVVLKWPLISLTLSHGKCNEFLLPFQSNVETIEQSCIFSKTLVGSPIIGNLANLVPPTPKPHEGKTILIATHDLNTLSNRFDEVLCLNRHVCAHGDPETVFTKEVLIELYGSHEHMFIDHKIGHHGI